MIAPSVRVVAIQLAAAVALFLTGMGPTMARAQGVVPSTSAGSSVGNPAPRPVVMASDVHDGEEPVGASPTIPGPPAYVPDTPPARVVMGPLEVIHESIFGAASKDEWQPLSLSTFFSEGWDQAYVRSPEGTNGAPKQNWLMRYLSVSITLVVAFRWPPPRGYPTRATSRCSRSGRCRPRSGRDHRGPRPS